MSDRESHPTKYLYKHAHNAPYATIKSASGIYMETSSGQLILDATGGAAVSAIGHGNGRVKEAIIAQLDEVEYCHPGFFKTNCVEQLADFLVNSTKGALARACITASGKPSGMVNGENLLTLHQVPKRSKQR